ncbi:MAG TPA: hypothetical protein PLN38_04765 [Chitinophagales bacterium]|nr:hypothetical protein [Chitinophagales bacterium]
MNYEPQIEDNYFAKSDYEGGSEISMQNGYDNEDEEPNDDWDDSVLTEIDFSEFKGSNFKRSLHNFNKAYNFRKHRKPKRPLSQEIGVNKRANIQGNNTEKTIKKILVPENQKVIVEGVDKFILDRGGNCDGVKNIGYYNCKKLKELIITMDNSTSNNDFNLELFNPSMPMDYLYATSGNLNNKVTVAGGIVSYSDALFNMLANPTHVVNAKFSFSSSNGTMSSQIAQPLIFKNKSINGTAVIAPLQLSLQLDVMQAQNNILFFDFNTSIGRAFIPDGMDVIQYKVLAGCAVTFSFFYRQKSLKRFFLQEARENKKLL